MAEKKVVVQVLADTKPFIKSLSRLKKLAEGIDSAQIRQSNKVLKNLAQNEKINKRIQKLNIQSAKLQETSMARTVKHQKGLLDGMMKYAAGVFSIAKLWGLTKKVLTGSYEMGMGAVSAGRTYGASPVEASKVNALYTAFSGKAGEGVKSYEQFMQNAMLFNTLGQGPLLNAASLFGIDERVLKRGDFLGFIKELRRVVKERNFDPLATQAMLRELGMGGDYVIMDMVTEAEEQFKAHLDRYNEMAKGTEESLKGTQELTREWNILMNNIYNTAQPVLGNFASLLKMINEFPKEVKRNPKAAIAAGAGATVLGAGGASVVGGILGSLFGPLGTIAGSAIGAAVGGAGGAYLAADAVLSSESNGSPAINNIGPSSVARDVLLGHGYGQRDRANMSTTNNITVNVEGTQDYSYYRQGQEIAGAIQEQNLFMNGSSG